MSTIPYQLGLHEVGEGVHAYLQPDGSWGYSNAGLVVGQGESLLVDTLFDVRLTRAMLDAMRPVTDDAPISTVVNTHANGDHCYGNQLLDGARIVSSDGTAAEMAELPASALQALKGVDLGEVGNRFVEEAFGAFDFAGVEMAPPTETFRGSLALTIGGREIELIEVGPAHTGGDVIVHIPDARTVFTGDILFVGSTPIIWAGPLSNWLRACERIRELEPSVVVPGHGPVGTVDALSPLEDYFNWLHAEVSTRAAAGMSAIDAASDIDLGLYAGWLDAERVVINVDALYAEVVPGHRRLDVITMMRELGSYRARNGESP
ncbi:MAG: MBL fold metallo-hydrolase [Acidimicrobiales bacterium]|jgi:cyclase